MDQAGRQHLTGPPQTLPPIGQFPLDLLHLGAEMKVGDPWSSRCPPHGAPESTTRDAHPWLHFSGIWLAQWEAGRPSPVLSGWPGLGRRGFTVGLWGSAPAPPRAALGTGLSRQAFPSTGGEGRPRGRRAERRKGRARGRRVLWLQRAWPPRPARLPGDSGESGPSRLWVPHTGPGPSCTGACIPGVPGAWGRGQVPPAAWAPSSPSRFLARLRATHEGSLVGA